MLSVPPPSISHHLCCCCSAVIYCADDLFEQMSDLTTYYFPVVDAQHITVLSSMHSMRDLIQILPLNALNALTVVDVIVLLIRPTSSVPSNVLIRFLANRNSPPSSGSHLSTCTK
jgi:hypothetical protein